MYYIIKKNNAESIIFIGLYLFSSIYKLNYISLSTKTINQTVFYYYSVITLNMIYKCLAVQNLTDSMILEQ